MKKYFPYYYDKFTCIADKCPDSCCKAWEIVIDEETYHNYLAVNGEIGERIRSSIITDEEGDRCFALKNGRCPFLNSCGLCDIHLSLGEQMTSSVCRDHPRFIEEYDGFTEISLSLSCPEASRIILSENSSDELYPVPFYDGEDEVLSILIASRNELLKCEDDFFGCVSLLFKKALSDEVEINQYIFENAYCPTPCGIKIFIKRLYDECEVLDDYWKTILQKAFCSSVDVDNLNTFISRHENIMKNILFYYIYRYYLKSVNDLDIYPRALFITYCVFSCAYIAFTSDLPVEEAARLFSKEIEHSTENIDIIMETINEY